MERINELKALIKEAQNIIIELGDHEWVSDQVRYQQNRIRAMQNEMDRLEGNK